MGKNRYGRKIKKISMESKVKDMSLAEQGRKNIELAEKQMVALMELQKIVKKNKPFKGLKIGMALHITKETAVLIKTLQAGGATVIITGCNPLSTQDDVAAALVEEGAIVFGHKGESDKEYYEFLNDVIAAKPDITIDDGCDLVSEIHKHHQDKIPNIIGGCEETTTGVIRIKSMEKSGDLKYPVVAVNDNKTKHLMDNYYGTGQSTLDGVMRATNFFFAGKTVVIAGYGSCGKGLAMRCKGMGSRVIVTEVQPFRALQAIMDGHDIMPMNDAAKLGDLFITVTGNKNVITAKHARTMKDGAIMCNSGHFDCEIDIKGISKAARKTRNIRPFMDEYELFGGKKVFILGEGRLINLAAAEGHPSDVMSLSFCGQVLACEYLVQYKGSLQNKVYQLPEDIDVYISELQLSALGKKIDELTKEQQEYLEGWEVGT